MSPIVLIGSGALILFIGVGLGYWFGNSGRQKEAAKAGEIQSELEDYRRKVTEHFSASAVHFQTIGEEYKRLYEHMAAGAGTLCETGPAGQSVSFAPAEMLADHVEEPVPAAPPPDYAVAVSATEEVESIEVEAEVEAEAEIAEPTDDDLIEVEAAEDMLAEPEPPTDSVEADKTLH